MRGGAAGAGGVVVSLMVLLSAAASSMKLSSQKEMGGEKMHPLSCEVSDSANEISMDAGSE